jgi:NADH-quinone oxidoreductase subunit I
VAVVIVNRTPATRSFWERVYLFEIVRGLWLTTRHFARNMRAHVLHLVGLGKGHRGAVTVQYPEERRALHPRSRGLHRLTQRPDGSPKCVACMMCATVCPSVCIDIVGAEHPDPAVEKVPAVFNIDMLRCCFCGMCVEACPEDAIRMDTGMAELSAYTREETIWTVDRLLANKPAPNPGKLPTVPGQGRWRDA